jgi:hypothetical protein
MKWIKDKIVISKKQAALYGVLFVIPCGIPIIILIEGIKYIRKRFDNK